MTQRSVTMWLTHFTAVRGRVHRLTTLGEPSLAPSSMATMTFRAPLHRSMAPPIPKARPGVAQLARSPCADTCRPPSTVAARRPQRMTLKDMATSKALLPGTGTKGTPPALTKRSFFISPSCTVGPMPMKPFSLWKSTPSTA